MPAEAGLSGGGEERGEHEPPEMPASAGRTDYG